MLSVSLYLFQIKLKMILLTSSTWSPQCEQTKLALYIKTRTTKDFIIWIRPRTVKFLQFQQFNLSFIVSRISAKFNFLHADWSDVKWTPKILIAFLTVMVLLVRQEIWQSSSLAFGRFQKNNTSVFSKLIVIPECKRSYLPCLRNGPDKNDSNNGNEHVGMQKRF